MAKYDYGDNVIFHLDGKDYKYLVRETFLRSEDGANDTIFKALGMNNEEKITFCSKAFGYEAASGSCPCCKYRDFDALSRLINAIEEECEKHSKDTPLIHENDKITFSGGKLSVPIEYKVMFKYLCVTKGDNSVLFEILWINHSQRLLYCKKAYGYEPYDAGGRCWPEFKPYDYEALLRLFDKLIADYGITITINDKPYKRLKIIGDIKYAKATIKDIKTLAELKSKLDKERLLDKVPSMTKDLYYANLSRIKTETPIVFTLKDKTLSYEFTHTWLSISDCSNAEHNGVLFKELGISTIANDLATACYGYTAGYGAWPDYKADDKKSLLRFLYVLSKEYDVKISIAGCPLTEFIDNEPFETTKAKDTTTYVEHPYDLEELETQATTLVDRSKLLNHRSPEISLTINHFSLKF